MFNSLNRLLARRPKGWADTARWQGQMGFNVNSGDFDYQSCGLTPDADGYVWTRNRVVNQGLNYMLNAALRGEGVVSTWYIAPFAANVTPAASVTAATFASTLTEFTNYTETGRVAWVTDAAATSLILENAAAPSLFTIGAGAQAEIYGGGLLSVAGKSATTGILYAAAKLPGAGLTGLAEGFEVRLKYRITGSSA